MRKALLVALTLLNLSPLFALAQSADSMEPVVESPLQAVIAGPEDIAVGRTIILDGSLSKIAGERTQYRWYVGESFQPISRSVEAVFTPERPGTLVFRLVVLSVVDGQSVQSEVRHVVQVFSRKVVLVVDASVPEEKILVHSQAAAAQNVHLKVLRSDPGAINQEESLVRLISDDRTFLTDASAIVIWTEGITGLQALLRSLENDPERLAAMQNQSIVLIASRGLKTLARTARGAFSVLRPKEIFVTRKEALNPLLAASTLEEFRTEIAARDIDALVLDASTVVVRPWNLLTSLVNFMLTHGVASQTVILLLVLPVIATILAFTKQMIGITTFGLFAPSVIVLSLLVLQWHIGLAFLLSILITGYATRAAMRRFRLLYIPKVAIILTTVSITLLLLIGAAAAFGVSFTRDTVFVLLIMSTLAESLLNLTAEEGWKAALLEVGETLVVALACVFFIQWSEFQAVILAYPELVLLTIPANVLLGRFTGLRLVEYFRFREVFRHLQEE